MFRWVQAGRFGLVRKIGGEYQIPHESFEKWLQEPHRLIQNDGRGLIMQGKRDWKDYLVEATITPRLVLLLLQKVHRLRKVVALEKRSKSNCSSATA